MTPFPQISQSPSNSNLKYIYIYIERVLYINYRIKTCQFLSLDRYIAFILSFDHSIFSSMSNYCDKLFAARRLLSICPLSITLILNIYYYCSVSRTSLPILTVIIIGSGQRLRASFSILRLHSQVCIEAFRLCDFFPAYSPINIFEHNFSSY